MQEERLNRILIKGGRVVDPGSNRDGKFDILITNNKITRVGKKIVQKGARVFNARGLIITPGFIDLHCHLRDPGRPDEETIESGSRAGIAGGFTTLCCMPNTEPVIDNEGIVNYIIKEALRVRLCRIFPIATITKRREGEEITEFGELIRAGAKGFSDDGDTVADANVLRHALEYSKIFDVPIFEHPIDNNLAQDGVMNEGYYATKLGLKGAPAIAEDVIVARDLLLAKFTGARLHLCHISSKGAVQLIRKAKQDGVRVTCETCPHYFYFNDQALETFDTNYKVNPPLRSEEDRQAIIEGLRDGTIDCIATDHAPHTQAEKELEFARAPSGMTGLETALSLVIMELINHQHFSWLEVIEKLTINPARILKEELGRLKPGLPADLAIIDPEKRWRYTEAKVKSLSRNSPLLNKELKGKVVGLIINGEIKFLPGDKVV
ncbi:hypothetical protein BXT86_04085 [candidate division WOR-3 bacterium 4484_100]|uniref:Dihydroorotase n=1 Tax=candidate division WOR-3 bacterium 4484_100 TaxID=1936077 RepID=A0A1V4QF80_UNCW3|nr:MAG: hypothetical protein BXT86_04085 [candidate division WOR-3 bacterium 4484_100]